MRYGPSECFSNRDLFARAIPFGRHSDYGISGFKPARADHDCTLHFQTVVVEL
jgi:hypothetical protein